MADTEAITAYLTYLENPKSLVDQETITRLEGEVQATADPLGKLKALAALDRARNVDPGTYREGFVTNAFEWAQTEGVPASAFRDMGVSDDVLYEAGFDVARRAKRTGGKASTSRNPRAPRHAPVRSEDVQSWVLDQREPFTMSQVTSGTGASPVTVKNVVGDLVDNGKVVNMGQAPNWTQRGRVPTLYRVS